MIHQDSKWATHENNEEEADKNKVAEKLTFNLRDFFSSPLAAN